ncbi:MAG TPA: SlyX family protein [Chthoniobacterales bacterium]
MSDEPAELEGRFVDLEMKISFLEEHVLQQDREILKLRDQVEKLAAELAQVASSTGETPIKLLGDERPPHY